MIPSILFVDHASDVGGAELSLFDTAMHWNSPLHVALMQTGPFADLLRSNAVPATVIEAESLSWASGAVAAGARVCGLLQAFRRWRFNSPSWPETMMSSTPTRRNR